MGSRLGSGLQGDVVERAFPAKQRGPTERMTCGHLEPRLIAMNHLAKSLWGDLYPIPCDQAAGWENSSQVE